MVCAICPKRPACIGPCQRPTQTYDEWQVEYARAYPHLNRDRKLPTPHPATP